MIPIPGISGGNLRHGVDAFDSFASHGDDLARYIGKAGRACSFDEETPVTTDEGAIPIKDVDVGDKVLAWDEATDSSGYFLVTATWAHVDPIAILLTVDGETIETTPEHPFLTADGTWVTADELAIGDKVQSAEGNSGTVDAIAFVAAPQVMYNMTVADAHTYVVGDGEWVVHNSCRWLGGRGLTNDRVGNQLVRDAREIFFQLPSEARKTVIAVAQGGNEKIVTAFIKTDPQALRLVERLAPTIGARYVEPWEITGVWGSGHAEQIAYRELQQYSDLKIGITHGQGPCKKFCGPFFLTEQFVNVFYPAGR
ncbi:MAG: polymorphic toxin-type HINT domain-containing protein [Caldilineaceae bacterium]